MCVCVTLPKLTLAVTRRSSRDPSRYIGQFHSIADIVNNAYDFVANIIDTIVNSIGGGRSSADLAPASSLAHCSTDVCVRVERRSGTVYRNIIFPVRFAQFFFERTGRVQLPGLFEGWVPRGIAAVDGLTTLITLHGMGPNLGAPSMIAVMNTFTGGVRRLIQLFENDGTTP